MLKAWLQHLRTWLNSLSLIQTALIVVVAFGGAWLFSDVTQIFGNVTGDWLWIEGIGWFALFASTFVWVQQRELTKNPPLPPVQPLPAAPPMSSTPPKPEPNVIALKPRVRGIHAGVTDDLFYESADNQGDPAALAIYENTPLPDKDIGTAYGIGAHVVFRDSKGVEIDELRIQDGCWMQARAEVNFPPRTDHKLLLVMKRWDGFCVFNPYAVKITSEELYAEVSLVNNKGKTIRTDKYLLKTKKDEFSIKLLD